MEALPSKRLYTFRYEDMVADPVDTLGKLMEFIDPGNNHAGWISRVADRPVPQRHRWSDLDPAIAREVEAIITPINVRLGYE